MNKINDFLLNTLLKFLFRTLSLALSKINDVIEEFKSIHISDILGKVIHNSFNDEGVFSFRS